MPHVKILDYFCRAEGEDLVCVVRLVVGGGFIEKELREKLSLRPEPDSNGRLGC